MSIQPTLRRAAAQSLQTSHRNATTSTNGTTQNNASSQVFHLPDGRTLGYAEYGSPSGKPLLYFHGYPSSRIEAEVVDDMARRCGIWLLALDRPGFGLSTPQPGRDFLDWPKDVREFAQGLNLHRFAVMGLSGGGPYALACAYALPKHMLAGVGLFASGTPWAAGAHHMSWIRRVAAVMSVYFPSLLGTILGLCVRSLRAISTSGPVVRRIDAWLESQQKIREEKEKKDSISQGQDSMVATKRKTVAERREYLQRLLLDEPFAQGVAPAVLEARLLSSQDWGFKFEDVDYDPVRIWHGVKDGNAPIDTMRFLAKRLPHAIFTEYENDTHYTMHTHFEDALAQLAEDFDSRMS